MSFRRNTLMAGEERMLIACVLAAGDAQDRIRDAERPKPALPDQRSLNDATTPAYHGISATERGQWDRLRAQGLSGFDAARIIKDARP